MDFVKAAPNVLLIYRQNRRATKIHGISITKQLFYYVTLKICAFCAVIM
jgi:hypothetical protein